VDLSAFGVRRLAAAFSAKGGGKPPHSEGLLIVCAIVVLACSHKTPEEMLIRSVEPAISWVATLQFAGEKWLGNSVPTSFVRNSVREAEKDFDKATACIDRSPAAKHLRDELRRQINASQEAAERLKSAIEKNDRRTVSQSVSQFAAAGAVLRRLEEGQ
jgi:hypothetical protein